MILKINLMIKKTKNLINNFDFIIINGKLFDIAINKAKSIDEIENIRKNWR